MAGGLLFGLLGKKTVRWGRDPIVLAGFVIHLVSFFLIFINLPNDANYSETDSSAYIKSRLVKPKQTLYPSYPQISVKVFTWEPLSWTNFTREISIARF